MSDFDIGTLVGRRAYALSLASRLTVTEHVDDPCGVSFVTRDRSPEEVVQAAKIIEGYLASYA